MAHANTKTGNFSNSKSRSKVTREKISFQKILYKQNPRHLIMVEVRPKKRKLQLIGLKGNTRADLCRRKHSFTAFFYVRKIHENGCHSMSTTGNINLVGKVIEVCIILLPIFISQHLNVFSIFWNQAYSSFGLPAIPTQRQAMNAWVKCL